MVLRKARRGQPLGAHLPRPQVARPRYGEKRKGGGGKKPQSRVGSPSMATPQRGNPAPRRPERGEERQGGGGGRGVRKEMERGYNPAHVEEGTWGPGPGRGVLGGG